MRVRPPGYNRSLRLARRARNKAWLADVKANPCVDCGGSFPPECMDFDHIDDNKVERVSQLKERTASQLQQEVAKCELVCANCHRMRTEARRGKSLSA